LISPFFQFCDSCLKAESFEEVDFSSILLEHDRYCITKNKFQAEIPLFLVVQNKRKSELDSSDSKDDTKKKRHKVPKGDKDDKDKSHYKDLGNMVKNQHPVNEWKVTGGKYKKTFTKEIMASTPAFNESGIITCNKWHVQGFCYEKCDCKATHRPFVSAAHRTAYNKWVKEQKARVP